MTNYEIPIYTGGNHSLYAYFAGCVDCDGWITYKSKYGRVVGLTQHVDLYDAVKSIHTELETDGIKCLLLKRQTRTGLGNTLMCNLLVSRRESLLILLPRIIPYLRFKKEKAIEAYNMMRERDEVHSLAINANDNSKRKYWKQSELDLMIELHAKGWTNKSIGIHMNRATASITQKLKRLGITRN